MKNSKGIKQIQWIKCKATELEKQMEEVEEKLDKRREEKLQETMQQNFKEYREELFGEMGTKNEVIELKFVTKVSACPERE